METHKIKTANSDHIVLVLFQYFVHQPGVTSTTMYRALIDKMCLWIYCCGMAAHIWWI